MIRLPLHCLKPNTIYHNTSSIVSSTRSISVSAKTMSDSFDYDLVTLGAGSGGVRASRFATTLYNAKVACVEMPFGLVSSDKIGGAGGTCVIRGCVPKKLLVYGSEFADSFQDAKGFAWNYDNLTHDWATLVKSKGNEIERLNGIYKNILKNSKVDHVEGKGSIVDANTVEIELADGSKRQLRTKNILIATGGVATRLSIPGADLAITSDEALSLESLPEGPIAILGAGYIATEFAGIFRGLHKDPVHLFFRGDKVLRGFDEECRGHIQDNLISRGINVSPLSVPTSIERRVDGKGLTLHYSVNGEAKSLDCGLVMMATGRSPRSLEIGLEKVGVALDPKTDAIQVDSYSRTNVSGIWAVGDVTNRVNLTPVALMEGGAFAKSCFGGELTQPDYQFIPSAVFTQPPLATVGFTEEQAVKEFAGPIDVYVSKFRPMKYTISGRKEQTLMKLIVHADSDRVIGCHMVGADAPEIVQGLAIALKCGATKAQFDSTIGIHPSAAEEFVTMRSRTRQLMGSGSSKL